MSNKLQTLYASLLKFPETIQELNDNLFDKLFKSLDTKQRLELLLRNEFTMHRTTKAHLDTLFSECDIDSDALGEYCSKIAIMEPEELQNSEERSPYRYLINFYMSKLSTNNVWKLLKKYEEIVMMLYPEVVEQLRKQINPYNKPIQEGADKYLTFSVTNLKEKHIRRREMTGIVSFLFKMLEEYEVDDEEEDMIEIKRHILKFLKRYFEFNPRVHVKPAPQKKVKDAPNPPLDVFYGYENYRAANFDQIVSWTNKQYCEKSDLEFAFCPYKIHDSLKEAKDFNLKHCNEVIADILISKCWAWTFLDSWKENREKVDFYNENAITTSTLTAKYATQYNRENKIVIQKKVVVKSKCMISSYIK